MPAWKVWFDPVVARSRPRNLRCRFSDLGIPAQNLIADLQTYHILQPRSSLAVHISSFTLGSLHDQDIGGLKPLGGKSAYVEHLFPFFSCSHLYVSLLDHACFDHSIIFNFLASNLKIFYLNFTSQFSRKPIND